MKKLLIILISLLLLTSCSSTSSSNNDSSIKEVDINENTTDVSNNDTNTINTEDLESKYNNISINNDNNEEYIYTSELLGIKATFNINEYRPLSKQEIIDKYHYAKDYYDGKHIGKLLYDGYSYYDLILNSIDNNTIISLSISKPGLLTYKEVLGQYTTKDIEDIIKKYENKGYKDVEISINTIDLFDIEDNKTALSYLSYIDINNNQIYQYSIFITNKEYMGILNIVSINEDRFDKALEMFEKVENNETIYDIDHDDSGPTSVSTILNFIKGNFKQYYDFEYEIIKTAIDNNIDYSSIDYLTNQLNYYLGDGTYTYKFIGDDIEAGFELIKKSADAYYPVIAFVDAGYGTYKDVFGYSYYENHCIVLINAYYDKNNARIVDIGDPYNAPYKDGVYQWEIYPDGTEHPTGQKIANVDFDNNIAHPNLWIIYHQ